MASTTAGPELHVDPPRGNSSTSSIEQDAPALLALHREVPNLHIYTASSANYETLCRINDFSVTTLPGALVRPTSESEIATAVRYISQNGLTLAIRSSGVDQGGKSRAFGLREVSLDLRSLDKMVLSADRQYVTIEGGVTSGKVLKFLGDHGLVTPTPISADVGYVGFACGGGYSSWNGTMSMAADNILGGRVVLADGRIVDTDDADCDPDLLWTLRGGGAGVVGVVSSLRVRVHRCPAILGGLIAFPQTESSQITERLARLYEWKRPDKLVADVLVVNPPGSGGLFSFLLAWTLDEDLGDLDEAKDYLERLLRLGTPVVNTVQQTTPYGFIMSVKGPELFAKLIHTRETVSVPVWSEELGRILSEPLPNSSSIVIIHDRHGAGTRGSDSTLATNAVFLNREPHVMLGIFSSAPLDDEEGLKNSKAWVYKVLNGIHAAGLAMPQKYLNFVSPHEGDGLHYYGADGMARIKSIKSRLDPSDLFAKNTPDLA
ncbi:FAD-binding domain-containing protein [Trichoderma austrokoningii]